MNKGQRDFEELFINPVESSDIEFIQVRTDNDNSNGQRAWSYFQGAELLVEHGIIGMGSNTIGHPLLYLYRHAIELLLKDMIHIMSEKGNGDAPLLNNLWGTHKFSELTAAFNDGYSKVEGADLEEWGRHKEFLDKWESADPEGIWLRYSTRKGRFPDFREGYPSFCMEEVVESCQSCGNWLRGIHEWLDDYWTP